VRSARRKGAASGVDARVRRGPVEDLYPTDNGEEPTIVGLELMASSSSASGPLTCVYGVVTGAAHSKGACRESCPSPGAAAAWVVRDAKAAARMGGMLASTSGRDLTG
jgi:hypothetical protein